MLVKEPFATKPEPWPCRSALGKNALFVLSERHDGQQVLSVMGVGEENVAGGDNSEKLR